MTKKNSVLKNIIHIAFSQGISLMASIVTSILLPKILNIEGYGFFRIFTLYLSYTALLHFGFIDGILLRFAGTDYESLPKKEVRTYSRFYIVMQLIIGVVILLSSFFAPDKDYRFIIMMMGVDMVAINITSYYQFLSQATKRFREYAMKNLFLSGVKAVFVLLLFGLHILLHWQISYRVYLVFLVAFDCLMLGWYLLIYHDITLGKGEALSHLKKPLRSLFETGILLTVAYQASHLIHMLDRQFVSLLYPVETYAVYAFSYHLVTLISTMVSSIAIVMFPMLKKSGKEEIQKNYSTILSGVCAIIGGALVLYYPLVAFIGWFLPEYTASIAYLKIILPCILYTGSISVVMFTFVKVLNENFRFFRNSLLILGLGFLLNCVAQWAFHSPKAISYASLVTMAVWFILEGHHLKKLVNLSYIKEFFYVLAVTLGFLGIVQFVPQMLLGMGCYLVFFLAITLSFYPKLPKQALSFLQKK